MDKQKLDDLYRRYEIWTEAVFNPGPQDMHGMALNLQQAVWLVKERSIIHSSILEAFRGRGANSIVRGQQTPEQVNGFVWFAMSDMNYPEETLWVCMDKAAEGDGYFKIRFSYENEGLLITDLD